MKKNRWTGWKGVAFRSLGMFGVAVAAIVGPAAAQGEPPAAHWAGPAEIAFVEFNETLTTIREQTWVIEKFKAENKRAPVAAVFVKNRADSRFDQKTRVLEDLMFGDLTSAGVSLISPEDTVTAMRRFLRAEEERERLGFDDRALAADENRLMSLFADRMLENAAAALGLARNMNADYIVIASIVSYGVESGVPPRTNRRVCEHRMRVNYRVLSRVRGESLVGGNVQSAVKRYSEDGRDCNGNESMYFDDLLADASQKVGGGLAMAIKRNLLPEVTEGQGRIPFFISVGMADLNVPDFTEDENGRLILTSNRYQLENMAVTVELDGVVVGSAPGTLRVFPGLQRLRLTREGLDPWERFVNILPPDEEGKPFELTVSMQLSPEGMRRYVDFQDRVSKWRRDHVLSSAEADLLKGLAETFKQSGIRIKWDSADGANSRSIWRKLLD